MRAAYLLGQLLFLVNLPQCLSIAPVWSCPQSMIHDGWSKDLGQASEQVNRSEEPFDGGCGSYQTIKTCEMADPYYLRMRVLEDVDDPTKNIIVFRGTQPQGEEIHRNRSLADCSFLDSVTSCGKVHARFQEGFKYLVDECHDALTSIKGHDVMITGHSLGGAFALFM